MTEPNTELPPKGDAPDGYICPTPHGAGVVLCELCLPMPSAPPNEAGEFDELVAVTIRTAVDEWRIQNDPADLHGVGMPEYVRQALADAGLLATVRLEQLTAEVERLKDADAEAFAARFQVQSYDIELGRAGRTLARLLTEAGVSPLPDRLWYLAHRVKEEFEAVVRQRDEALAALEKQQQVVADIQESLPALGACSCWSALVVVHEPGSECADPQYEAIHELLDPALVEANLAGEDGRAYGAASRAGDLVLNLLDILRGREEPKLETPVTEVKLDGLVPDKNLEPLRAILRGDEPGPGSRRSSTCGAQEGMTGIRCDLAPGHQDQHSGRHTTTHGPDDVGVNIQWDRASWDTCAPAKPVWVAGNREPGGDVVQSVQGRMTGRVYRRDTEHFGGAWRWGAEPGQWVVWGRLLEDERVAEAVKEGPCPAT